MGYVEGQGFHDKLNPKTWHRDRWIYVPVSLFIGIPTALAAAPFLLLMLSVAYFVDRWISPGTVSRKSFLTKAWLWVKSTIRFFIRFWRTGFMKELEKNRSECYVCGEKFGNHAWSGIGRVQHMWNEHGIPGKATFNGQTIEFNDKSRVRKAPD